MKGKRVCTVKNCDKLIDGKFTTRKRCPEHVIKRRKCHHGKVAQVCKEIECVLDPENKTWMCIHKGKARRKNDCRLCNKDGRCPMSGIIKRFCACCEGSQVCRHGKLKSHCKEKECVDDAGGICECGKRRNRCRKCGGGYYCEHNTIKHVCKVCNETGHLMATVRKRVYDALKSSKTKKSIEYLGCTVEFYKKYIEEKFEEGMSWENHGEWHIDHIIPLKYDDPTMEQVIERLHYTNTQPLWARDNLFKGNRFI